MDDKKKLDKRLQALNRAPLRQDPKRSSEVDRLRKEIKKRQTKAKPAKTSRLKSPARRAAEPAKTARPAVKPSPSRPVQPILYRRDLPEHSVRPLRPRLSPGGPVRLEEAVEGIVTGSRHGAGAYVITSEVLTAEGAPSPLNAAFHDALHRPDSGIRAWLSAMFDLEAIVPADAAFFDLETTGLASTPVFLIGAMSWEGDRLVVKQFFARDYSEEPGVLSLFFDWVAEKRLLVSFNGKSFDLPYTRVRAAANGVPFSIDLPHFDLLHVARRVWKGTLPNHRLQTLERYVCGRVRQDDIPSWEIPEAYHAYVRTANAAEIVEILRHNMLDLVTLADLMVRLPPPEV